MPHKAKIVEISHAADGLLAVRVRCCDDALSESVLTLGGLDRSNEAIDADIQAHTARVEKQHADKERAAAHLQRLMPCQKQSEESRTS